jgi:subtilase family serine protease
MRIARTRRRAGIAAAAALPLLAGSLALGVPAHAEESAHGRELLSNTKPRWATAKADHGSTSDSTKVTARVYLAGKDRAGLARYAKSVSDPHSDTYQKYLSAKEARARFGVTKKQIAEVTAWLKTSGLKVTGTNQHYVSVTGSSKALHRAFGVELHNYTKDGRTYHAPDSAASVPSSLSGAVLTVVGLDNAPKRAKHDDTLPPPADVFRNAGPFSSYHGSKQATKLPKAYGGHVPYAVKGYTGKQLRSVYGASASGLTGKGASVAITDAYASPTIADDAAAYAKRNGDKPYGAHQFSQLLPGKYTSTKDCDASGWYGEESLDVEAVHALAPDADITYVGASSCNDPDLLDSVSKVVDHHLADIVSNSWGDVEANETPDVAAAYDHVFQLGAVEGIGFYFSTGDDGDNVATTGAKQVGTPANSPWVTAVGGTSLAVGKDDDYTFETGWGTDQAALSKGGESWKSLPGTFTSGAGGGTSTLYDQPFYQRGVVPDALATAHGGDPQRVLPDIAAVADPNTGFLMGQTQRFPNGEDKYSEYRIGGTSLAAPVISGIQALAQQGQHGKPVGFANPALYARSGSSAYHDVTDHPLGPTTDLAVARVDFTNSVDDSKGRTTTLRTLGKDSSLSARKGYDDVTGVGSPATGYLRSFQGR